MNHMMRPHPKAEVVTMVPNAGAIVEAILHIVTEAEARRQRITQYDVVKSLFLGDRAHLNRHGRPITYDNYKAMVHGPVPGLAYDILCEDPHAMRRCGIASLPWTRVPAPDICERCFVFQDPARPVDEDVLSPSDMEELSQALTVVKALGFRQVRKLTHEDQAYLDAWEDDGDAKSFPMSYALMFDSPDLERAREVAFLSQHL